MDVFNLPAEDYNKFYKSLQFVLDWETAKGTRVYSNDPSDPGGETKWGIAKRYHPNVDIKNLTADQAAQIYYDEYWLPSGAARLSYPECLAVFNCAVNPGLGVAKRLWQEPFQMSAYTDGLKLYYAQKVKENPAKQKYLAGWLNRVADLEKFLNSQTPLG